MMRRTSSSVVRAVVAACVLAAAATVARAEDPAPESDPAAALRAAAEAATGESRAPAFAALAAELERLGLWADAAAAWRGAGAAKPSPEAATGEGRALLAFAEEVLAAGEPGSAVRGAFEDARAALRRAVALGSKDVAVRIGLARCLAADGRADAQIAELRAAATDFPTDAAPRRALAFALFHAERFAESAAELRPLSDAAPDDLNLALTLAACARRTGDEPLALAMAGRTMEHHPQDRRGWEALWAVYAPAKRWGELADRLGELSKAHPDSALAFHYAGFAAASALRWDDALARLDRTWELDRKNAAARLEAARIRLVHRKDRDRASSDARDVLTADPSNRSASDLLSFVAQRRSEDGDHAGAIREIEAIVAARPDDVVALSNLGVELKFSGRYAESEKAYLRALEVSPGDAQVLNDLALSQLAAGRRADARATFLKGVEADPTWVDNMENLGWLSRQEGRTDEAADWYRRCLAAATARGRDVSRFVRALDELAFPLPR